MTSSERGLTVLLTNLLLAGRSGTEVVVRNLARALVDLGHQPLVYSPRQGRMAEEIRALSVPVIDDIRAMRAPVDVIHGHHLPTTVAALARFPGTPALFVCHDFVAWHDRPPLFPSVRRFVAVDETVAERLRAEGVEAARLRLVLNQPDIDRFTAGPPLPNRPRRALVIAKNHGHVQAARAACDRRGIALDVVGPAVDRTVESPEQLLPAYDLVFASALTAMEAIACGRGVVVCDGRGLAGWVSPARFDAWRPRNFGLRTLRRPLTAESIGEEIDRFSPDEAVAARDRIRGEGGVRQQAEAFVALYREMLAEPEPGAEAPEAFRVAMAGYVQEWSPAASEHAAWVRERALLLAQIDTLASGAERCQPGTTYAFNDPAADAFVRPLRGFSLREGAGRWTDGATALLAVRVPEAAAVALRLRFQPFVAPAHAVQRVAIDANGLALGNWEFRYPADAHVIEIPLHVPADRIPDDGQLWLRLLLPDAVAPAASGGTADPRLLGLNLIDLQVEVPEAAS